MCYIEPVGSDSNKVYSDSDSDSDSVCQCVGCSSDGGRGGAGGRCKFVLVGTGGSIC